MQLSISHMCIFSLENHHILFFYVVSYDDNYCLEEFWALSDFFVLIFVWDLHALYIAMNSEWIRLIIHNIQGSQ